MLTILEIIAGVAFLTFTVAAVGSLNRIAEAQEAMARVAVAQAILFGVNAPGSDVSRFTPDTDVQA